MVRTVRVDSPAALIAAVSEELTPTERRIATAVLDDPSLLAFGTVADVARHVGTSRPSVVRFAVKLGFEGFTELQENVQQSLSHRLFRPTDRVRQEDDVSGSMSTLTDSIAALFDEVADDRLAALGDPIADADAVWVISGETSLAGATALVSRLSIVRPQVHFVDGHSVGADLARAGDNDVAIAFDFFRYRQQAIDAARAFVDAGVDLVAITDGPLSPLASLTDKWMDLAIPAVGPFDSSVPAVAAAELLVSHVTHRLHDDATARIDRTEAMWAATRTFVES